jgi:hypothetical protein
MYREYVSGVSPAYCLVMIVVLYTTGADVNGRLVRKRLEEGRLFSFC